MILSLIGGLMYFCVAIIADIAVPPKYHLLIGWIGGTLMLIFLTTLKLKGV